MEIPMICYNNIGNNYVLGFLTIGKKYNFIKHSSDKGYFININTQQCIFYDQPIYNSEYYKLSNYFISVSEWRHKKITELLLCQKEN